MNSKNNATNDQKGLWMLFMLNQLPCINVTTSYHFYNTNIRISNKKIATFDSWKIKMIMLHSTYLVSFCIVNSKYWVFLWVFIFSTYPKSFINWGQKKRSCFRKSAGWNIFYHSPSRIVGCVSQYIFLISK